MKMKEASFTLTRLAIVAISEDERWFFNTKFVLRRLPAVAFPSPARGEGKATGIGFLQPREKVKTAAVRAEKIVLACCLFGEGWRY
jgi:hypothetical protein